MTPSNAPRPSDSGRDDDVDPTGIRDLLRALPDPGPMPEHVVRRLETRLAVELAHRAPSHPFNEDHGRLGSTSPVVDLAGERSRRRPARAVIVAGAAAAGLLVVTVAVSNLLGSGVVGGADTAAYAPASDAARQGGDTAGGGAAGELEVADEQAEAAAGPDGGSDAAVGSAADDAASLATGDQGAEAADAAPVLVLDHLGQVDQDGLAQRLDGLDQSGGERGEITTLSAAQANSCWGNVSPDMLDGTRYAAPADEGGRPVVVLWFREGPGPGEGPGHAWLLPAECAVNPAAEPLADVALAP